MNHPKNVPKTLPMRTTDEISFLKKKKGVESHSPKREESSKAAPIGKQMSSSSKKVNNQLTQGHLIWYIFVLIFIITIISKLINKRPTKQVGIIYPAIRFFYTTFLVAPSGAKSNFNPRKSSRSLNYIYGEGSSVAKLFLPPSFCGLGHPNKFYCTHYSIKPSRLVWLVSRSKAINMQTFCCRLTKTDRLKLNNVLPALKRISIW